MQIAQVPPSVGDSGSQMSDLQMTKLCAEAITHGDFFDYGYIERHRVYFGIKGEPGGSLLYAPLLHDGQAMELIKRFELEVYKEDGRWMAAPSTVLLSHRGQDVWNAHLNRAIVECVAKMQVDRTAREAAAISTAI